MVAYSDGGLFHWEKKNNNMGYDTRSVGYMRIAFFTDTYEPQKNGVVTSINFFASALRSRGHKVKIFSPAAPGYKNRKDIYALKSFEFKKYPGYRIAFPFLKPSKIKNFDIIHVHTPATMGVMGMAFAKYYKLPLIGTFHTLLPEFAQYVSSPRTEGLAKKALWKYSSIFYRKCDITIAPTSYIKSLLERHGVKNVVVVPTGIKIKNNKKNRASLRKRYGFAKSDKIILHVGRISKEKNIQFIMRSLKKMLRKGIKLVIASDGPYRKKLEQLAGKNKNIIFTGFLSERQLDDYYSLADVFVAASKSETQGLTVLEAASYGLPIVAYDSPVISEFIKEAKAGYIAKGDFAKRVGMVLSNKKVAKKFKNNATDAAKKYGHKRCANELIKVYQSLLHQ